MCMFQIEPRYADGLGYAYLVVMCMFHIVMCLFQVGPRYAGGLGDPDVLLGVPPPEGSTSLCRPGHTHLKSAW